MKRTKIVERARMLRRNCSASGVCLYWAPPTKYVMPLLKLSIISCNVDNFSSVQDIKIALSGNVN